MLEVSLLVKQPHSHQRHAEIAGPFQMIARQHAETSGEHRQALGQAELGRKIGHQHRPRMVMRPLEPCAWVGQIPIELLERPFQMRQERFVFGRSLQLRLVDRTQHQDRIVPGGFP